MFKLLSWEKVTLIENQVGLILLIILLLLGSFLSPFFLTPYNLYSILWAVSVLGIVCLGQAILLITANFDMSVSMVVPFTGIVTVGAQMANFGLWSSVMIGLLVATLIGLINGFIVVITKANAFLITFVATKPLAAIKALVLKPASALLGIKDKEKIKKKLIKKEVIFDIRFSRLKKNIS